MKGGDQYRREEEIGTKRQSPSGATPMETDEKNGQGTVREETEGAGARNVERGTGGSNTEREGATQV